MPRELFLSPCEPGAILFLPQDSWKEANMSFVLRVAVSWQELSLFVAEFARSIHRCSMMEELYTGRIPVNNADVINGDVKTKIS